MQKNERVSRAKLKRGAVALGLMLPVFAAGSEASACETVPCAGEPEELHEYVPFDGATVPANLRGLFWVEEMRGHGESGEIERVFYKSSAADEPIGLTQDIERARAPERPVEVMFESPLVAGNEYRLRAPHSCTVDVTSDERVEHVYQVSEAAEIPERLGVLKASPSQTNDTPGECGFDVCAASSTITLKLSNEATPWRDAMWFVPHVNGEPWEITDSQSTTDMPIASALGHGEPFVVYAACDDVESPRLRQGNHVVEVHAYLPGRSEPIVSEAVEIDLKCQEPGDCGEEPALPLKPFKARGIWYVVLGAGLLWAIWSRINRP